LSAEDVRRLCAVPEVSRPEREDLRDYSALLHRLRTRQGVPARKVGRGVKRCANPACPCPGELFRPREGEPWAQFRQRRFCSVRCGLLVREGAKAAELPPIPAKGCRHCGKPLVRREGEEYGKFRDRQFCDRRCQWNYQKKPQSKRAATS